MLECFILCSWNDAKTQVTNLNIYSEIRQTSRTMFSCLKNNLVACESLANGKGNKPSDENNENLFKQNVVETPPTSLCQIGYTIGLARTITHSIKKQVRLCQQLLNGDPLRRMAF